MIILSYLGAHWTLFIIVVLGAIALFYATWVLKNLKYALWAIALIIAGFAYQSSNIDGYKRRVNEEKAQEVSLLKDRIATLQLLSSIDNQRAISDAKLNSQLKALSLDTPKNDGACLDAAAAHRVFAIAGTGSAQRAAVRPSRISNVLPWRHKRP